jgi:CBS domain-containing protein
MDTVSDHPARHRWSPSPPGPRPSTVTPLFTALARARRAGGPDGDVLALTARWSAALRGRLDASLAATGSVGRGEATPTSDLDVIRLSSGPTPRFTALLADGVTADAAGVSPSSTVLPTTRAAWATAVTDWCARPGADRGVVKTALLADAADEVSHAAAAAVPGTPMVTEMLRDALSHTPPRTRGILRADSLSLKTDLITPVVKIARWAALSSGSTTRGTVGRLTDAVAAGVLDHDDAAALDAAYREGLSLSLDLALGIGPTRVVGRRGRVMFSALPGDRSRRLRHSVEDLRGLQRILRYRLSTSSFTDI